MKRKNNSWACPNGAFQKTIVITAEQTDALGSMRPSDLARQMQCATEDHMEALGLDVETLRSYGLLWVLVRTAIWVKRMPRLGECVLLRTWPGDEKHWLYPRRFEFISSEGGTLASASSLLVMMDEGTRSLVSPENLPQTIPGVSLPGESEPPTQRVSFPAELTQNMERVVQLDEIDFNGHLNNARYLDWAEELLDKLYLQEHNLCFIWAEYSRELRAGQKVTLQYGREEDSLFLRINTQEESAFSVNMDFSPARLT